MRKVLQNKKGFTLIELLAVIVILGVIMVIAIPSVTGYITNSRKDSMISSAKAYVDAVVTGANGMEYEFPTNPKSVVVVTVNNIKLDRKQEKSAFNSKYDYKKSYVVIENTGTVTDPRYTYYVALQDIKGNTLELKEVSELIRGDVKTADKNAIPDAPTATGDWTVKLPKDSAAVKHTVEELYNSDAM